MRLKIFVITISIGVVVLFTGLFSLKAGQILGDRSHEVEVIHREAVTKYSRTLLEAKKYLLSTYQEDVDKENRLSKMFLLAQNDKNLIRIRGEIVKLKNRTGCDLADIVYLTDGSAIFEKNLGEERGILVRTRRGESGIRISDTGRGISNRVLSKLFIRGASFGKASGSGLGLWHARKLARAWHGDIVIRSEEGKGTEVDIVLPLVAKSELFISKISISPDATVIVLDDDGAVYEMWRDRFQKAFGKANAPELIYFNRAEELLIWKNKNDIAQREFLLLCDFELTNENWTGLQVIEELEWAKSSILVTGHFEDRDLRLQCEKQQVRLLPKTIIPFVPLVASESERSRKQDIA